MLKAFFEFGADKNLFEEFYILKNKKLSEAYIGKYPVIFLINDGRSDILFYAIAFYKKRCRVKAGKLTAK